MKIWTVLFFAIFLGQLSLTGQGNQLVSGIVLDATTREPLEGVNVYLDEKDGCFTDANGKFRLETERPFPFILNFSYVGYLNLEQELLKGGESSMTVYLVASPTALPDILVTSRRKIDTLSDTRYSVIDYDFIGDKVILLAYRNSFKKYSLIALNEDNSIFGELDLIDYRPVNLFRGCKGDVFLRTKANYYFIKVEEERISLGQKILASKFSEFMEPCLLATENFTYFSKDFYQNQAIKILGITEEKEVFDLAFIQNERNIDLLIEEMGLKMPYSGDVWEENVSEKLKALRESPYKLAGMMRIFYPPLYAPLFSKNENLCLFSHAESKLYHLTPTGEVLKEFEIDYHKERKWKKRIYYDSFFQKAYTCFDTRWGEVIREINLETGKLTEQSIPIEKAFIEKIKIRKGCFYFLYNDITLTKWNKVLHKIRID